MPKFCGNCGCKLEDDARVCGNCGVPFADVQRKTRVGVNSVTDYRTLEKKIQHIKRVRFFISVIVFWVIMIAAVYLMMFHTGYKWTLNKIMNAYKNYDIDTLVDLSSDVYFYDGGGFEAETSFASAVEYGLDTFYTEIGHDYKFSYKIVDAYSLKGYQLNELITNIENTYSNFDTDIVQSVMIIEIEMTAKAKNGVHSVSLDQEICLSKEDGTWKLLYIN